MGKKETIQRHREIENENKGKVSQEVAGSRLKNRKKDGPSTLIGEVRKALVR